MEGTQDAVVVNIGDARALWPAFLFRPLRTELDGSRHGSIVGAIALENRQRHEAILPCPGNIKEAVK